MERRGDVTVHFVHKAGHLKPWYSDSYSDINRFVILDGVTIVEVQSGYLVWELAGDEKFCDSKRSVTLNVVILNGFDCIIISSVSRNS